MRGACLSNHARRKIMAAGGQGLAVRAPPALRRSAMSRFHPMLGALVVLAPILPAAAQQQAPAQPPAERILPPIRYSLPPGEGGQQNEPQTPPPVETAPAAPPRVIVPTATPTPRATPSPRATPRPTPTPRATASPEAATPERDTAPADAAPLPAAPVETPAASVPEPQPLPLPTASPSAAAPDVPAPVPAPTPRRSGWEWLAAIGVLALLVVAWLIWRRRRADAPAYVPEIEAPVAAPPPPRVPAPIARRPAPTPAAAPPPNPAPAAAAPPPPPVPVPAPEPPQFLSRPAGPPLPPRPELPAGTITAFRNRAPADAGFVTAFRKLAPQLGIELNPIRAGVTDEAGFVEFQFAMINASDQAVSEMLVSAWILSASPDQDARIRAHLNEPMDPAQHSRYRLQPGEHREHRATMGLPFEHMHVVEAGGRRFFAPMLLVDARYRGQGGGEGRSSAAFMIGRPNPATGKLLPVYLDRGPRAVDGLAARPYPLGREAA